METLLLLIIAVGVIYNIFITHKFKNKIMATQKELAQALSDLKDETVKINAEVTAKLQALADALANQGNTTPEVDAALADLQAAVKGVDDLIEDQA